MISPHIAVEASGLDVVDSIFRSPESLLVGEEKRAVVVQADSVGGTKAGGENIGATAVGADTKQRPVLGDQCSLTVTGGFGVVEVSIRVCLEVHGKLMEMLGHLMI